MLAALLALPPDTTLDYTGLPQLASPQPYEIRGHSATIRIDGNTVVVESTTEYRNRGGAGTATLLVPRRRAGDEQSGQPTFNVEATWDKKPIKLSPTGSRGSSERIDARQTQYASDLTATVSLGKQSTHALRLRATTALGKAGRGPKQRIAGYLLEGGVPFGVLNLTFQYGRPTVFGLPEAAPSLGWQIGDRGAFVRKTDYTPSGEIATVAFWPGGFGGRDGG